METVMNAGSSRMFLLLCGLLYLGFGLWVLLRPAEAAVFASLHGSPGALEDLAGSHGGMNVALGLFCIFAALSMAWHRPGLYLVGLVNAGYLAGRVVRPGRTGAGRAFPGRRVTGPTQCRKMSPV
jgi:hypothetical protein